MSDQKHGFFYPLVFPFYQERWISKTWWLNLIAIIPIVNLILLSGWRLNLIRRMVGNETHILPDAQIGSFLKGGIILWAVGFAYVLVPLFLIALTGSGEAGAIIATAKWLYGFATGAEIKPAEQLLQEQGTNFVIRSTIEFAWLFLSMPIYRLGMLRYAITGNIRSFLNIPLNAALALRYSWRLIMMWIFGFFMLAFIGLTTSILSLTVVLTPLAPIFGLLVYFWATGYEYGHLAHDIQKRMERQSENQLIEATDSATS